MVIEMRDDMKHGFVIGFVVTVATLLMCVISPVFIDFAKSPERFIETFTVQLATLISEIKIKGAFDWNFFWQFMILWNLMLIALYLGKIANRKNGE